MADVLAVDHGKGVQVLDIAARHTDPGQKPLVAGRVGQEGLDGLAGVDAPDMGEVAALIQAFDEFRKGLLALADDDGIEGLQFRSLLRIGDRVMAAQADMGIRRYLPRRFGDHADVDQADGEAGDADHVRGDLDEFVAKPLMGDALGHAIE